MSEAAPIPGAGTKRRRRFRFSIRSMLLAVFVVGFALFLYRELPDMVRKRVYNDPIPLVVTDKTKIQIRQVPYAPGGHFLYRLYLPSDQGFELCVGEAGVEDALPTPKQTYRLGPLQNPEGLRIEWRVSGFTFNPDPSIRETRLDVKVERIHGPICLSQGPLSISFPALGTHKTIARKHPTGFNTTETLPTEDPVPLYRELWSEDSHISASIYEDALPKGPGIVVWIRPAPVQKKSPSR